MFRSAILWLCFISVSSGKKDVELNINPITSYIGDSDTSIECKTFNSIIKKPQWIIITFDGHDTLRPLVSLTKRISNNSSNNQGKNQASGYTDDVIEWGSQNDVNYLENRINVTGKLDSSDSFLRLVIKSVECADEGRYVCQYAGLNENGHLVQMQMGADLIVYSYHDRPRISLDGHPLPRYYSLSVKPDEEVNLECNGVVGKPPVPVYWMAMEPEKGTYRELTAQDGVGLGHRVLPTTDLCRFTRSSPLKFEMKGRNMVLLKCEIGVYDHTIIIHSQSKDDIMKRKGNPERSPSSERQRAIEEMSNSQWRISGNTISILLTLTTWGLAYL